MPILARVKERPWRSVHTACVSLLGWARYIGVNAIHRPPHRARSCAVPWHDMRGSELFYLIVLARGVPVRGGRGNAVFTQTLR
eukprot:3168914-Pleurochrysis_carterae.AAC.1